jgi:predicted NBD/HSP70 family sugar kinase
LEQFYRDAAGEVRSLPEIIRRARLGSDQRAEETLGRLIDYFGQAISVVINIVDPDVIVLAGGVSNIDELYTLGAEAARKNTFNPRPDLKIVRNQLGDSAGVFGAACLSGS